MNKDLCVLIYILVRTNDLKPQFYIVHLVHLGPFPGDCVKDRMKSTTASKYLKNILEYHIPEISLGASPANFLALSGDWSGNDKWKRRCQGSSPGSPRVTLVIVTRSVIAPGSACPVSTKQPGIPPLRHPIPACSQLSLAQERLGRSIPPGSTRAWSSLGVSPRDFSPRAFFLLPAPRDILGRHWMFSGSPKSWKGEANQLVCASCFQNSSHTVIWCVLSGT